MGDLSGWFAQVRQTLSCVDVLRHHGIEYDTRRRIPCPIHGGGGRNFGLFDGGRRFTCQTHQCGSPHVRDALNLHCLLRHGAPLPALEQKIRADAIREIESLAGLPLPDASPQERAAAAKRARERETLGNWSPAQWRTVRRVLQDTGRIEELSLDLPPDVGVRVALARGAGLRSILRPGYDWEFGEPRRDQLLAWIREKSGNPGGWDRIRHRLLQPDPPEEGA